MDVAIKIDKYNLCSSFKRNIVVVKTVFIFCHCLHKNLHSRHYCNFFCMEARSLRPDDELALYLHFFPAVRGSFLTVGDCRS